MKFETIVEGLRFPEGPVAMEDGSIILVEIARGTLTRCWSGKTEVVAQLGGGPNGAAIGPDGAMWVCNNGGFKYLERDGILIPHGTPDDYSGGRIERVDLATGKVERVYDRCGDYALRGPNDIVFDKAGGMWFTDYGKDYGRTRDKGAIYYALPDGSQIIEAEFGSSGYNGIGLSPDESVVYAAETSAGRLWAFDVVEPGKLKRGKGRLAGRSIGAVSGRPEPQFFDSLAVTASGKICVATLLDPCISQFSPDGTLEQFPTSDPYTTNICFGGADMMDAWITLSGGGSLVKTRWPEPGLRLNFNA